ncbi:hypothetical protein [Mucisphaera sp.]|uniref:hypothetical protein n=1 Tax=Mucisphaera sp. TaxID=2913024 RepID=UPI003D14ABF6
MDNQTAENLATMASAGVELYLAAALVVVGLVMLLAGRKLARACCVLVGLALGSTLGAATGQIMGVDTTLMVVFSLIGSLLGALFAGFLFRAFVAVTGAILLAAVVPAAMLAWQGTPPPQLLPGEATPDTEQVSQDTPANNLLSEEQLLEAADEVAAFIRDRLPTELPSAESGTDTQADPAAIDDAQTSAITETITQAIGQAIETLRTALAEQEQTLRDWWATLSPTAQSTVMLGSAIGAAIGLLLGLLMPKTASALESSLLGACLIYLPGTRILAATLPAVAAWFPTGARGSIIAIGLITILGVALQWTIHRKKTDS